MLTACRLIAMLPRASLPPVGLFLDHAQAMDPAAARSAAGRVIVAGCVVRTMQRTVAPQSVDLEGASAPMAVSARRVRIVLDRDRH